MDTQTINQVLLWLVLMVAAGVVLARESAVVLDWVANWAASRSYGLKCQRAEMRVRQAQSERSAGTGGTGGDNA